MRPKYVYFVEGRASWKKRLYQKLTFAKRARKGYKDTRIFRAKLEWEDITDEC